MSYGEIHALGATDSKVAPVSRTGMRAELLKLLRGHRLPEAVAHDLAKTAEQSGLSDLSLALACALDRRMKTAPLDVAATSALLLVGPHGAGKTAVIAKIAAHARLTCRSVRLIGTETTGAGANARLAGFAQHLGVPMTISESAEALAKTIGAYAKQGAFAVIDTPGFDPCHDKLRSAFAALAKIEGVTVLGVVSACGDAEEIVETIEALAKIGATHVVVTCVDVVRRLGALAAAATGPLSVAHITCSPYVAAGLEVVSPLSLAHALLNRGEASPYDGSIQ